MNGLFSVYKLLWIRVYVAINYEECIYVCMCVCVYVCVRAFWLMWMVKNVYDSGDWAGQRASIEYDNWDWAG